MIQLQGFVENRHKTGAVHLWTDDLDGGGGGDW